MKQGNPVLVMNLSDGAGRLTIEYFSEDTIPEMLNGESGFHIYHVRMLTELILRRLSAETDAYSLSEEQISAIAVASSLHDIGKVQIPQSILDYPGKLSPVEYDIVKKHSAFGETMIRETVADGIAPDMISYAAEIARWHHERYDGTGYPDGLRGDAIPLPAQVVALADSFDALTSPRSYKQPFSQDVAIQMISSGMCGVFSEKLVEALLQVVNHRSLVSLRETVNKRYTVVSEQAGFTPKRVLCAGNTEYLTEAFIETSFPESQVTVVGNTALTPSEKVKLFGREASSLKSVFNTYEFDTVVYFSDDLTLHSAETNTADELREVLQYASECSGEIKVLYLSSLDSSFEQKTDKGILAAAKEQLCDFYAKEKGIDIKIVQIPYLYSGTVKKDFLYSVFETISSGKTVRFEEAALSGMHFLSMYDLAELVHRILGSWKAGSGILTVSDDFHLTYGELAEKLSALGENCRIDFFGKQPSKTLLSNNKALRNEYGWFSGISIIEDIPEQYEAFLAGKKNKTSGFFGKLRSWIAEHLLFVKIAELILLFLLTELLVHITRSAVFFTVVDFRMAFIVIMATVHGLNFGIASAALSSVSWFAAKVISGTDPLTIFYEPTNWLAFVFFFLVGAICGYIRLRSDDTIRVVREERKMLEDKLVFTREIYEDTLREKRDLKKQIIGSKDSFGKIFDITRRLNTVESQKLYLRIMDTFEEVLENKSITVYSVTENSAFARLEVASRDILETASRSISTDHYAQIIETLQHGEIWRNTELLPDFPMYAAGVYRGDKPVLIIFLWHADMQQRSLYYVNLFRILRDLAEMSLLRAHDYNQAIHDRQYIKGTRIMQKEPFEACLKNFTALTEKKVASFVLLGIDCSGHSYEEVDAMLTGRIRANDILGVSGNGTLKLLLSQADASDLKYILPRFEELDIRVSVIN